MSSYPSDPQKPLTSQELDTWLLAAQEQRAKLHIQAASPRHSLARQQAFMEMSGLLEEAFEEVRVVSAQLRDTCQKTRAKAIDLQQRSARLLENGIAARDRMAQFLPPAPEALQEAESRLLDIFRSGKPQA
jgi:DNA repair ATPase RecN